jgi:Raf kinase inhibitor-like YbhB/YbcL family protein
MAGQRPRWTAGQWRQRAVGRQPWTARVPWTGRAAAVGVAAALAGVAAFGAGCGGGGAAPKGLPSAPARIHLFSAAFARGAALPAQYTCAGAGLAPPLRWSHVPRRARALALLVEDPDVPGGTFVHWALFDIPPATHGLSGEAPPPGARQAVNSAGKDGWTPPCPPAGAAAHRYVFTVYALRTPLVLPDGSPAAQVIGALRGLALARGELVARFGRS